MKTASNTIECYSTEEGPNGAIYAHYRLAVTDPNFGILHQEPPELCLARELLVARREAREALLKLQDYQNETAALHAEIRLSLVAAAVNLLRQMDVSGAEAEALLA